MTDLFRTAGKYEANFTLNLGVRYQFDGVPFESGANFSNLLANPDTAGPFDITVVGPGTGKQMYNDDYKDIEPRVGFAWDPFKDWQYVSSRRIWNLPRPDF